MHIQGRLTVAALVAVVLFGCGRDFSLPVVESGGLDKLDVNPKRVGPGGVLDIGFEVSVAAVVEVTVNDRPTTVTQVAGRLRHHAYTAVGDEGPVLNVVVTATSGGETDTRTITAALDIDPPATPDAGRVSLVQNPPGTPDQLEASAGFSSASDAETARIFLDPAARILLVETPLRADGGFDRIELGDNLASRLFLLVADDVGNESAPIHLENDIEGPGLEALDLSPLEPRANRTMQATLRFDETVPTPPAVTLSGNGGTRAAALTQLPDGRWVAELMAVDAGPALLLVTASDAAGNARDSNRLLDLIDGAALDPAALFLERSSAIPERWSVRGDAGAAAVGASVEVRGLPTSGTGELWGVRLAASDGSFARIERETSFGVGDAVEVTAYDSSHALLDALTLRPDLSPPQLLSVDASPSPAGPGATISIVVQADEPLLAQSSASVGGLPATLLSGADTSTLTFEYVLVGTEPTGPATIQVRAIDGGGNEVVDTSAQILIDLSPPTVTFAQENPEIPPTSLVAPAEVSVTVSDSDSGVASTTYRLFDVRTGKEWDGSTWGATPSPVTPSDPQGFLVPLGTTVIAAEERVRVEVTATDAVGNQAVVPSAYASYTSPYFIDLYPSYGTTTWDPGYSTVLASPRRYELCMAGMNMQTSAGAYDSQGGDLFLRRSSDGGDTWSESLIPGVPLSGMDPQPYRLTFDAAGQTGLLVGSSGLLVRVASDCTPLEVVDLALVPSTTWVNDAAWDGTTAWIVTDTDVRKSTDQGQTWSPVVVGGNQGYYAITTGAPGEIYIGGEQGTFFVSTDGGASWTASQPAPGHIFEVEFARDGTLYLGGVDFLQGSTDLTLWFATTLPTHTGQVGPGEVWHFRQGDGDPMFMVAWDDGGISYLSWHQLRPDGSILDVFDSSGFTETWILFDLLPVDNYTIFGVGTYRPGFQWLDQVNVTHSGTVHFN